jgi:long-chain fatty acid transport protein
LVLIKKDFLVMKTIATLTAMAVVLSAVSAQAAGFHLREQSAAAQGNAFAGATAGAENASYAYFNVAGLTRQKGTQVNVGGTYIAPEASAGNVQGTGETGDVHNIVHSAVAPNGTVSYELNDKVTLGLALNVPFGMITKYNQGWAGSDHGVTSKVTSVTTTPMVAYKATDKLSLGVGLPIQYMKARLTNTYAKQGLVEMEGDTVDVGYQLGAMYELSDKTRFGVGYRSEVNHKLKGDVSSALQSPVLNQDINARLDTPAMLSVGAYHEINDKWAVMAEYQRVYWSSFDSLDIYGDSTGLTTGSYLVGSTKENWRDTNFYSIGASYQIDNQWKARFGLAYDEAAVKFGDRTPRIPDSDRIWYSVGLGYQYNEALSFDMAFTYIDAKKASVDTLVTQNKGSGYPVSADYSNSVKMWGLSMNYKF